MEPLTKSSTGMFRGAVSVSIGYVVGYLSAFTTPVVVGSMMSALDLSESQVGNVLGVELLAIAIVSLAIPQLSRLPDLRRMAVAGIALAILGHLLIVLMPSVLWLYCAHALAGVGGGLILAAANRLGASLDNPDRAFAIAQLAISLGTALTIAVIPLIVERWGYRAHSLGLLVVFCAGAPLVALYPRAPNETVMESVGQRPAQPVRGLPHPLLGILCLLSYALMCVGDVGVWTFMEPIGDGVGLETREVGILLSISTVAGLCGALLAAVIGNRFGRFVPLGAALLVMAASNVGLALAEDPISLAASLLPQNFIILFMTPFFLGALADLDHEGHWTMLSGVLTPIAFALGPIVFGYTASSVGYDGVGFLGAFFAITAFCALSVTRLFPGSPMRANGASAHRIESSVSS